MHILVRKHKSLLTYTALTLAVVFLYQRLSGSGPSLSEIDFSKQSGALDITLLQDYGLPQNIQYARCDITVEHVPNVAFTSSLGTDFPTFYWADTKTGLIQYATDDIRPGSRSCAITIQVPQPKPRPSASHILFGMATTAERLLSSLEAIGHWASGTGARIVAIVEEHAEASEGALDSQIASVKTAAAKLDIHLKIIKSKRSHDERWFSLLKVLYEDRRANTKWISIIDDDTFFLSIRELVNMLRRYDSNRPHYVGGLSEDLSSVNQWGFMAFGGAGVFLSLPLARQLQGRVYEQCLAKSLRNGDRDLANCIYRFTTTKLDWEHRLHQMDLRGDQSGFYESGREQPLSVHHWKSWFHHDMALLKPVSAICGDASLFRRWRFEDGWYLVNGFSIVQYSNEVSDGDITMEKTWYDGARAHDISYNHALAPLREKDEGKISYRLEGNIVEDGVVRQIYIRRGNGVELDGVVELTWHR